MFIAGTKDQGLGLPHTCEINTAAKSQRMASWLLLLGLNPLFWRGVKKQRCKEFILKSYS